MQQDFTRRITIIARSDIESWQSVNAIAHIAAFIGNKLGDKFGTGENFTSENATHYPRNSQYPIIVKQASSSAQLHELLSKTRDSGLIYHAFVREMINFADDAKLQETLSRKNDTEIDLLGVGILGTNEEVMSLTKKFGLWK